MKELQSNLFQNISALLENARKRAIVAVNQTMVLTYFEIGRMIVEEEQNGENRAEYGKRLLKDLSLHLTEKFGRGFSVENLDRMRFFYKIYSEPISSTLLTISQKSKSSTPLTNSENEDSQKAKTLSAEFQDTENQQNINSETPSRISEKEISSTELTKLEKSQTLSDLFKISQTPPVNFNLSGQRLNSFKFSI